MKQDKNSSVHSRTEFEEVVLVVIMWENRNILNSDEFITHMANHED